MNTELKADMILAIEKSLPKTAGDIIKQRLIEAEQIEAKFEQLIKDHEIIKKELDELKKLNLQADSLKNLEVSLRTKENALKVKEAEQQLKLLEKELDYVKVSKMEIKELVGSLFRNIEFRKNIYGTIPFQDNQGYPVTGSINKSEDNRAE